MKSKILSLIVLITISMFTGYYFLKIDHPIKTTQKILVSSEKTEKHYDLKELSKIMNTQDLTLCEKEKDQNLKDQCEDAAIYKKSVMSKNIAGCSAIKNTETLGRCVANSIIIGSGKLSENPCLNLVSEDSKTACNDSYTTILAVSEINSLLCDSITDTPTKEACIANVTITEVIKKKDTSLCAKISDIEKQKICTSIQF